MAQQRHNQTTWHKGNSALNERESFKLVLARGWIKAWRVSCPTIRVSHRRYRSQSDSHSLPLFKGKRPAGGRKNRNQRDAQHLHVRWISSAGPTERSPGGRRSQPDNTIQLATLHFKATLKT